MSRASTLLLELGFSVQNVDTGVGEVIYDHELTQIHEVYDARQLRMLETREGLPEIL